MLDRPSIAVKKSAVMRVGALLALMAILVLSSSAPNGVFAHPHDDIDDTHMGVAADTDDHIHIHYAENGTDAVRDFDSIDPEDSVIEWNVRGVDAADFEISSTGVLTFMESPDYENPTDRGFNFNALNEGASPTFTDEEDFEPDDNNYQITVSATEMRARPDDPLPAKRTDIALTVIVGNADDTGELTLQWLQPEVTTPITATLTDPDGLTSDPTWTWYTSKAADPVVDNLFHWTLVDGQTGTSYTPAAADEDRYLWVHVAYTDPHGAAKTADDKSENPVRAAVSGNANASPDFEDNTDTRTVPESTAVGDPVGGPVTATDTDNDTLTYELDDNAVSDDTLAPASDLQFFDIDMETGQIAVAQNLDYDAVGEGRAGDAVAGTYTVTVRATDPSGEADNITVTIMAKNVNEDPIVTGRAEISVPELTTDGVYVSLPDAPDVQPDTPGSRTYTENEYVFEEPDHLDSIADWQLEGDDAAAFDLSGGFEPRYIQFKEAPDFENPTDANNDNVYEVTLVAIDTDPLKTGAAGIGKVNVWLTVTNVDEDGKVVFTEGETAYLNEMLVAEVQDPDDKGGDLGEPYQGVHIVTWQWSRAQTDAADTTFDDIDGATTNRYTPKDDDRGYYLRAIATYTDPHSAPDDADTDTDERIAEDSLKTGMATTDNVVRLAPGPASVPTFDVTGTVTREVGENTAPGGNVGAPVAAMGPGTLVYSLEGSDAKYFNIDGMGQITVGGDVLSTEDVIEPGTDPKLNYDAPDNHRMFSVTVKVEVMGGDASQNAEVDVNIIVTDVDEPLVITDVDVDITDADVDLSPMTTPTYPEIDKDGAPNTAAVATYAGTDPEGDSISWDLRGADAALFTIDGGVLQFVNPPDYEDQKDRSGTNTATPDAMAGDNDYVIVIRAIASRASGDTGPAETVDTTVTVTVTDVDEDGEVVISWLQPEVEDDEDDTNTATNTGITATLTDPDGPPNAALPVTDTKIVDATWEWTVSEIVQGSLDVDNNAHWGTAPGDGARLAEYTPVTSDENKYLRVTASYTDRNGDGKTERMMSAYPVQAAGLGATNQSPDFEGEKVERSVAETAAVGADVDDPVVATVVARSDTDILTYGLRAVIQADISSITGVTLPSGDGTGPSDDLAAFDIDKATGQITVAQKLDFESRGTPANGKYVVVVTVTDPSGLGDIIVVVITARDMNEVPVLRGRPELTIREIDGGDATAGSPLFVGNTVGADPTVNVYNVDDEDDRASVKSWRLEGEDKAQFQLIGTVGRTLVFTTQPDYENPADADGDNVYKVTVVAIDNGGARGEFDVCIAVMNFDEAGKITLRDEDGNELVQPHALGPITAELTDPDGGVTGVTWQWERSQVNPPTRDEPLMDIAAEDGGTSATYTPTNVDTSFFLKVTATYMDAKNEDPGDTEARMADATAAHAVLEVEDLKRNPEFSEETVTRTVTRMVAENAPSTTFVGEPLSLAMDLDDPQGVRLTYTLEDSDNGSEDTAFFELFMVDPTPGDPNNDDERASTQIMVSLHDEAHDLDHEAEDRNGKYEVVLKVTDESGLDDAITVTITVTDRNEAPSTPMEASDGAPTPPANNAPEFPSTETGMRSVPENTATDMPIGDPVAATDADAGDTLTYTLGGTDMASFAINSGTGQIMVGADSPDFEMPADADGNNAYEVTVTASDGNTADDATMSVTIMVTDMGLADSYDANEDGMIDSTEVLNAVEDYFNDVSGIESERILDIVELYFSS